MVGHIIIYISNVLMQMGQKLSQKKINQMMSQMNKLQK
nr:YneF family protein [Metabacillus litoralis]